MSPAARRALIVERSPAQRSLLASLLRDAGVHCTEAASMSAGLRKASAERFDLICVADRLRDGTAEQMCSALRATPEMSPIPVLALTSDSQPERIRSLLDAGATEVMSAREIERIRQFLGAVLPPLPALTGRVLIVDDDRRTAAALLSVLRHLGLEASHVSDALDAMSAVRKHPIDLLIIGAMLHAPFNGAALIREVRALPGTEGRTPILAMAAHSDPARRIEVLRSGADDYIPKPVLAEELTVRVERLLREKRREEESEAHRATFEALSLTDPLTTLNNRRFLKEVAPMYLSDARRHRFALSVVVVDIDQYEQIVRQCEPPVCEEVLRSIGRLVRRECRRGDVAVRCKDDQFVLLLSHCALNEALRKAEALRSRIADLRPCGVVVTISAGIAQAQDLPGDEFAQVFARAAQASRAAAQAGRNQVAAAEA